MEGGQLGQVLVELKMYLKEICFDIFKEGHILFCRWITSSAKFRNH